MAITQAVANSFKVEILKGLHNFTATTGNAFKLALYDSEATLSKSTTAFTQTDEVANSAQGESKHGVHHERTRMHIHTHVWHIQSTSLGYGASGHK